MISQLLERRASHASLSEAMPACAHHLSDCRLCDASRRGRWYPVDPVAGKKQFFIGTSLNKVTQLLLELGRRKASKEMGHLSLHYWRVGDQGASRIVEMPVVILFCRVELGGFRIQFPKKTEWRGRKHMSHMRVWHSDVAQRSWKEKHQSVYLSVQVC